MYDLILDAIGAIIKHGWSVSTAAFLVILLFKQRRMRNRLKRYLPFLFQDESEVKQYVQNQQIIMENQLRIMKRLGVEPCANSNGMQSSASKEKTGSIVSLVVQSVARSVGKFITYLIMRGKMNMEKFKSRKFWIAVISAALIIANDGLDLGIETDTVMAFATVVVGWIFGESYIDGKKVKPNAGNSNTVESHK